MLLDRILFLEQIERSCTVSMSLRPSLYCPLGSGISPVSIKVRDNMGYGSELGSVFSLISKNRHCLIFFPAMHHGAQPANLSLQSMKNLPNMHLTMRSKLQKLTSQRIQVGVHVMYWAFGECVVRIHLTRRNPFEFDKVQKIAVFFPALSGQFLVTSLPTLYQWVDNLLGHLSKMTS